MVYLAHPTRDELMPDGPPLPGPHRFMGVVKSRADPWTPALFASSDLRSCPFLALAEAAEGWLESAAEFARK